MEIKDQENLGLTEQSRSKDDSDKKAHPWRSLWVNAIATSDL